MSTRVKLTSNNCDQAALHPQLLTFPSGIPADVVSKSMRFSLSTSGDAKETILESSGDCAFNYRGSVRKDDPQATRFAIGIFDPDAGTVTLSSQGINLFTMQREPRDSMLEHDRSGSTYAETKRLLIDDFGSKKRKRAMKSADMNRIDVEEATAQGAIQQALIAGKSSIGNVPSADAVREFLPPYDANALDTRDIYPLDDIITTEQRCSIDTKPIAKLFKSGRLEDDLMFLFVLDRLAALKAANPGREVVRSKLGVLVYLGYLIDLYIQGRSRISSASDLAAMLGCSEIVAESLLSRFRQERTLEDGRVVFSTTSSNRVSLLCYICVLALTVSDFSLPKRAVDALQSDLKIAPSLLLTHFEQVGATIKRKPSGDDQAMVSLTAPLKFPSAQRARPGRK
ncbi:unnamed protein product (mitochondrion) [Plasmodiophora brassicae]|uniref:DNA-directed RNA polymerase I subunit RPA49 n=2 Tax=Plasmodiophora brassicae TaxID=37360 RepID=A0A3P3YCR8_PLABS|nr:unnamed protein product [Plasmodiophora brassicae]